jgi:uncharacterized OB-fold protein
MQAITNATYAYLRQGQIMGLQCSGCGAISFPPQGLCPACGPAIQQWVPLSGKGTLLHVTAALHRMVGQKFLQGTIRLAEGPLVSGVVLDDDFDLAHPEAAWSWTGPRPVVMELAKNPSGLDMVAYRLVR